MVDAATSDEALARRVKDGDPAAFAVLDQRYRVRLLMLLRRRVGCVHDAEDLTQQALARAYEKIEQYDDRRAFRPWLFTLALRLAIDLQRKPARRTPHEPWREEAGSDSSPGPLAEAQAAEERSRVWAIADAVLDDKQRTLLWLHYVEELSQREIGKAMAMTAVNVRVSLHRARKALAPHLVHLMRSESPHENPEPESDAPPRLTLARAAAEGTAP